MIFMPDKARISNLVNKAFKFVDGLTCRDPMAFLTGFKILIVNVYLTLLAA